MSIDRQFFYSISAYPYFIIASYQLAFFQERQPFIQKNKFGVQGHLIIPVPHLRYTLMWIITVRH